MFVCTFFVREYIKSWEYALFVQGEFLGWKKILKNLKEKSDKLNSLEAKWFKEVELLGLDEEASNRMDRKSKLTAMLSPMLYSLLNNVHVSLNALHVRFEDPANQFSFDTDIESIVIRNDDATTPTAQQQQQQQPNTDELSCKLFELKNFSIYTTNRNLFDSQWQANTAHEVVDFVKTAIHTDLNSYLIEPTSFKALLVRDLASRPLRKREKPRIRVNTVLNDFNLNVNETQLAYFGHIAKFANIYKNALQCVLVERPVGKFVSVSGKHLEIGKKI